MAFSDTNFRLHAAWLALALAAPTGVHAAESYGNCKGYIDSLPATISTQGVWCLRQDVATALTSGAAITIATNNVTLDCNDYKIGGLAGGTGTDAIGILAGGSRLNAVVRNCNVRGFRTGIRMEGSGDLVEGNRIDGSTVSGIQMLGDGSVVRANTVSNTGSRPDLLAATAIEALGTGARVLDNDIHGVSINAGWSDSARVVGIHVENGLAQGNRLSGFDLNDYDYLSGNGARGIELVHSIAADNIIVVADRLVHGTPIEGDGEDASICRGNHASGFDLAISGCAAYDNVQAFGAP